MFDIPGAVKAIAELGKDVFAWVTGGHSRDENAIRSKAEDEHEAFTESMVERDRVRANRARSTLRRVREQAKSKRR